MRGNSVVAIMVMIFFIQSAALGNQFHYVVVPQDTVSKILFKARLRPLYGNAGSLKTIENINAQEIKNIDQIRPGQKIYFSDEQVRRAQHLGSVDITNERQIILRETLYKRHTADEAPPQTETTPIELPRDRANDAVSSLNLNLTYQFTRLDSKDIATGGNATFLSPLNSKYELIWLVDWNSPWTSELGFSSLALEFDSNLSGGRTFTVSNGSLNEVFMGARYKYNEDLQYSFVYTRSAIVVSKALSLTELSLDQVQTNKLTAGVDWKLKNHKGVDYGFGLNGSYIMDAESSSESVKPGWDARLRFYLKHKFSLKDLSIEGAVFYHYLKQDTDFSRQSEKSVGAMFGVVKRFGN